MVYLKAIAVGLSWAVLAVVLFVVAVLVIGWLRWRWLLWRATDVAGSGGIGFMSGGVSVLEMLVVALIGLIAGVWRTLK